ncbi:MAG: FG-GAP-like repeat-containing protein [Prevotellaceae bacterium]|nr:FG-GAP-like repeat-containing protein [Prevotellaceae bacterium]
MNRNSSGLVAHNGEGKPIDKCVSLQRRNTTVRNGAIAFQGSDYIADKVKLIVYNPPDVYIMEDEVKEDYIPTEFTPATQGGTLDVSPTGASIYTIPIVCPAGIQGVQPNVALTYNSQGRNGIAGWGWSIAGGSAISRVGGTMYHDSKVASVELTAKDNLMLDGQRLFLVSGSHFANGAKYRTEVETFVDITYKNINDYMCFEVITKDGKTLYYGVTADSYIKAQGSSTPLTWLLARVEDANSNYMTYTYGVDDANGEFWLSKIAYTGNKTAGRAPVNEISFEYEGRQDVEAYYVAGKKTMQSKRLKTIAAKSNSQLFHRYALDYNFDGLYSKLVGVKEATADEIAYSPLTFSWEGEYDNYSKYGGEDWGFISENLNSRPIFADFNGDGRRDFITIKDKKVKLYLNYDSYGTHFFKHCEFTVYGDNYKDIFIADLNGDGLMDLVSVTKAPNGTYRYNYHFFNGAEFNGGESPAGYYGFNEAAQDNNYIVGDFNGDGKHEILIKNSQKVYNQYGNQIAVGGITDWGEKSNNVFLFDITGNEKINVCIAKSNASNVYELIDGRFQLLFSTSLLSNKHHVYPGDYNGDGKIDLFVLTDKHSGNYEYESYLLLSTGVSFVRKNIDNISLADSYDNNPNNMHFKGFTGDFNLDGKTDIVFAQLRDNGKYVFKVGINNGNGFTFQIYNSDYAPNLSDVFSLGLGFYDLDVADYDGDGRSEVCFNRYIDLWRIQSFRDSFFPQVAAISNDLNENICLSYLPITTRSIYASSDSYTVSFPLVKTLSPLYVVSNVYNNNHSIGYYYKNIRIHKQGKGFLGFGELRMTNYTTGIKTTTEYGYNISLYNTFPEKITVATTQDSVIATTTYKNSMKYFSGKRIFPYISKQTTDNHLNNLSTITDILGVDDYGNITSAKTTYGNITETVTEAYSKNGSWCPNKPDSSTTIRQQGAEKYTRTTLYEYDAKGNLVKETKDPRDVNKVITEYKNFDVFGHATRMEVTANGSTLVSTLSYTPSGRFLASKSNALGETTTYLWSPKRGLLLSETDATGLVTSYKYDSSRRLRETIYPDGSKQTQGIRWVTHSDNAPSSEAKYYTYDQLSDGVKSYTWFDHLGREVCHQTFGLNDKRISVYTAYDYVGRKSRISKPKFDSEATEWAETYTYDKYGRLGVVATPRGDIHYTYNGRVTTVANPEGAKETAVNAAGQVATSKTNGQTVSYTYHASGLTKSTTPEGGQAVAIKYDLQGNKVEVVDPNAGKITCSYNGFGQLVASTDARGYTNEFKYDKLGRTTENVTPEATYTYSFNAHGLESVKRNGAEELYTVYDELGRIKQRKTSIENERYTFSYKYDEQGLLQQKNYPNGFTLNLGYSGGLLTSINNGGNTLWKLTDENAMGQPKQYSWGNGQQATLAYDSHSLLQRKSSSGTLPLQEYVFNSQTGNLAARNLGAQTESFDYDNLHRLTHVNAARAVTYAANGNIATKADVGAYLYNNGRPHAVTDIINPADNLDSLARREQRIAYDSKNRPLYIAQGADSLTFYYDHTGQRLYTKRYKAGALYKTTHYVGSYEREIYADSVRTRCFVHTPTGLHAVQEQTTKNGSAFTGLLYVHTDHLGSIVALTNANGSKLAEYSYDPWGRLRDPQTLQVYSFSNAPSLRLGRGFTGHEHLPEFGLINMNARLYDPLLGRFLSPDPYVADAGYLQDFNRYSYARNNPLIYTDPTGENPLLIALGVYFLFFTDAGYQVQKYISPVAIHIDVQVGTHQKGIGFDVGVGVPKLFPYAPWAEYGKTYFWQNYGGYQGWETRKGTETTYFGLYTEGKTEYKAGEFSQTVGYKKIGIPGSLGVDIYNDLWGDGGDRFRTSRVRLNLGLLYLENVLFTGDPGLNEKDRHTDKIEKCGPNGTYIQNPNDPYAPDPNKYRHGVLSIGIGPISIGYDSENIRYALQNVITHNITDSPYFRYEREKRGRWYFQFGAW